MKTEVVIVPTYTRPDLLRCCLKRIRDLEPTIPISVFPDQGSSEDPDTRLALTPFLQTNIQVNYVPQHDYHGNTFNAMEAMRWAYNEGYDRIFYIEDDVMVHPDFFSWHREMQDDEDIELFASMGWVFNRFAPIAEGNMYQPWYYAIGTCFARKQLFKVVQHATPHYYADMQGYIEKKFPESNLNSPYGIQHFEQDGLIQRVLDQDKSQTVSPGICRCSHMGLYGYNRGWNAHVELFTAASTFDQRIKMLEEFIADPYARALVFGRDIVEREIGHELPKREFHYTIRLPGGWESDFVSELEKRHLPPRINSVPIPCEAEIVLA